MKVVINNCFGGFGLSPEAITELWRRGGPVEACPVHEYFGTDKGRDPNEPLGLNQSLNRWRDYVGDPVSKRGVFLTVFTPDEKFVLSFDRDECVRSDAKLVQLVEEMGEKAYGPCSELKIVEVPDDASWEISEYDGREHVAERHRTWS